MAELADLFKPPPPLPRAEAARRKDGDRKKRKSQADGTEAPEGGSKKKRKKSAKTGEQAADGEQAAKPRKPRAPRPKKSQNAGVQPDTDGNNTLLNLSPSETARRQEEARKKLEDSGIDPDTLSAEQFNIFANQSPDLQMESLAMLVKYGAERLRIVHPNKDNTPQSGSPAPANGDVPSASTKKKASRKKAPGEEGAPKVKRTRGSCQACRAKKIKASSHPVNLSRTLMLTLSSAPRVSRSVRSALARVLPVITHLHRVASQLGPSLRKQLRTSLSHLRWLQCQMPCQTRRLLRSLYQRRYQRRKPRTWAHQALILPILLFPKWCRSQPVRQASQR